MYPVYCQVNYWKQSEGSSGFDSMFRNGMSKKETFQEVGLDLEDVVLLFMLNSYTMNL